MKTGVQFRILCVVSLIIENYNLQWQEYDITILIKKYGTV